MDKLLINPIGELKKYPGDEELLISEPTPIPFFDNYRLPFVFADPDPVSISESEHALQRFLSMDNSARILLSQNVAENYRNFERFWGDNPEALTRLELKSDLDIWKFVYPSEIWIMRDFPPDGHFYVSVQCECEWEKEHGLQLVFRDGIELVKVGGFDGHLF